MRALLVASVMIAGLSPVMAQDVFPGVVDGVEYVTCYGRQLRPGWSDGLKFSEKTRRECERRLAFAPPPAVCMVRVQLSIESWRGLPDVVSAPKPDHLRCHGIQHQMAVDTEQLPGRPDRCRVGLWPNAAYQASESH
jgi:hypothetical protein